MTPGAWAWIITLAAASFVGWILIFAYADWQYKEQIRGFKVEAHRAWLRNVSNQQNLHEARSQVKVLKAQLMDYVEMETNNK